MKDFLEEVSRRLVLGDGDLPATLEAHGHSCNLFPEELNLSNPDAVTAVHASFLNAGAQVIRTNSLRARAHDLEAHGLENRLSELHWLAAQLAKSAARGTAALVAGTVGQENHGTPSAYQARVGALLDGGSDLIFFENFTSLDELIMALHVKQALHHCPAICSIACSSHGDFAQAFRTLQNEGADVVGGPFEAVFPMMPALLSPPMVLLLSDEGNDGPPHSLVSPSTYAERATNIKNAGGGLLFGGSGIRAEHVNCANEKIISENG